LVVRPTARIFIPVKVHVYVPGAKVPVLMSDLSVSTLLVIDPVHNTPAEMNASGVPDNAIRSLLSEKVMRMVSPAPTGATDVNVIPNGWH